MKTFILTSLALFLTLSVFAQGDGGGRSPAGGPSGERGGSNAGNAGGGGNGSRSGSGNPGRSPAGEKSGKDTPGANSGNTGGHGVESLPTIEVKAEKEKGDGGKGATTTGNASSAGSKGGTAGAANNPSGSAVVTVKVGGRKTSVSQQATNTAIAVIKAHYGDSFVSTLFSPSMHLGPAARSELVDTLRGEAAKAAREGRNKDAEFLGQLANDFQVMKKIKYSIPAPK